MFFYMYPDKTSIKRPSFEKEAKEAREVLLQFYEEYHAAFRKLPKKQQKKCSLMMRRLMLLPGKTAAKTYLQGNVDRATLKLRPEDLILMREEAKSVRVLLQTQ